jgi:hypothetical protein
MTTKKFAIYCATKKEILNAYDKFYKNSYDLYHHFYPNHGTQPSYVRKRVLSRINKDFKKDFLRDDLIDVNEYKFDRKILKDFDDMEKDLEKIDLSVKINILKVLRCYYHPDDFKNEKKKSLKQLHEEIQPYLQKDIQEIILKNKPRPSPSQSAKLFQVGQIKKGNDGNMYQVKQNKNKVKRWVKKK